MRAELFESRRSPAIIAPAPAGLVRVLHVYRTYFPDPPGGIQESIRQISHATKPLGVESTVFCLSPRPEPKRLRDNQDLVTWRSRALVTIASCDFGGMGAWRRFAQLAREHDVIHYHFPWPFADLLHLTVRPAAKKVLTYHSDIVRQSGLSRPYTPMMWRMLVDMESIVATSPTYARTSTVLRDKRIADRVRVIPLGMKDLSIGSSRLTANTTSSPYVLFLGALRYYKGLHTLLDAAPYVNAKIVVAGEGTQGEALRRRARDLQLTNVEFVGPVSEEEKIDLLRNCRAFVLPSHKRSEAFGMALIEAAMFARPLVTCEVGSGTSFVNLDRKTGFVVEPENPRELSEAVNALLQNDGLALRFGKAARARYEALFSDRNLGFEYSKLYRQLTAA